MILIVDDDAAVRATLGLVLKRRGYEVTAVAGPDEALVHMRAGTPELVIMDMNFSRATDGSDGLHLLRQCRIFMPRVPVILITGWGSIELAVAGMRAGAFDFITKPWDNRMLLGRVETALSLTRGEGEPGAGSFDRSGIIGESPALKGVLRTVERVAPTEAPVLILGENGTGKELIAEALHRNSRRRAAPFVKVNLGGISSSLFESEMFGHVRGAFTGAVADRAGRFEMAEGGTIFLDEIGDLDASSQVKLLRVLQEHTYERLGDSRTRRADVRVVCATNMDLKQAVAEGRFREDLYYRINLITLRLPALRERRDDLGALTRHFVAEAARRGGLERTPAIDPGVVRRLGELSFPGNIRQLRNMIDRAVIVCDGSMLRPDDFDIEDGGTISSGGMSDEPRSAEGMTLAEMERRAIAEAVRRHEGNLTRAAAALGITRQSLYRRMEKLGLEP